MADERRDDDSDTVTHTRDVVEGRAPMDEQHRAELEAMVRQHYKRILSVCYQITRDPETASEVAQDALLQACHDLPKWERRSSLSTWICGIAKYKAMNRVRRVGEFLHVEGFVDRRDGEPDVLRLLSRAERRHLVTTAAQRVLDPLEQDIVHHRFVENLDYEHIAGCLGLPGGGNEVRVILQRIKRRLKPELERELHERGHGLSFIRTQDPPDDQGPVT